MTFDQRDSKDSRDAILKVEELHNENISCLEGRADQACLVNRSKETQHQRKPHLPGEQLFDIHADASRTATPEDWHRSCGV